MRHFTDEEKRIAVDLYFDTGKTSQQVVDDLAYPTRQYLERWLREDPRYGDGNFRHGFYPIALKREAVRLRLEEGLAVKEIASRLSVKTPGTICHWIKKFAEEGDMGLIPKSRSAKQSKPEPPTLPSSMDGLKERCEELELENAVMKEMSDVLKVDPCASTADLSGTEKITTVDALPQHVRTQRPLCAPGIARSTYHHARAVLARPDKHAVLRERIHTVFADSQARYGYRRIWTKLRMVKDPVVVLEKSDAPENLVARDFLGRCAQARSGLTDITEMRAADGKLYLSPVIDCFDGMAVAWKMSRNPNAELANSMLEDAIGTLPQGVHPLVHSDRGVHYRWDGWIDLMRTHGLVRSMSRKGCSLDDSAAEGFFGRLKIKMYYGEGWENRTVVELATAVDEYMHRYNKERIKMSLGGLSPLQYRRKLRLAA